MPLHERADGIPVADIAFYEPYRPGGRGLGQVLDPAADQIVHTITPPAPAATS